MTPSLRSPTLDDARWQRLQQLFAEAGGVPAGERELWLAAACAGDPLLARELASLLAAAGGAGEFLERPVAHLLGTAPPEEDDLVADGALAVGPWRLLAPLGRGGMGTVYLACRADQAYRQKVAVKVLRRGLDTADLVARFRRERQILAQLEHPAIARLLDGGTAPDGRPYLVMEHVDGQPIDRYCDAHRLDVPARLRLFRRVCSAVTFAHQNLVVHRDLKPANILITAQGEPKLLDFGVAKLLAPDAVSPEAATITGPAPLTPRYASPEQREGAAITTASDVYSLGVVLFELLTGKSPGAAATAAPGASRTPAAAVPRPSVAAASIDPAVAAVRGEVPRSLSRRLAGDLDTLVLTALESERERRYPSAEALGEDLDRSLSGHPLVARAGRPSYLAAKFLRRHRLPVGLAAAALIALLAFLATLLAQRRQVLAQQRRAETVSAFLVDLFALPDPTRARGESVTARELLDRGAQRVATALAEEPAAAAELAATMGRSYRNLGLFQEAEPLLDRAVELARAAYGERDTRVAGGLQERGDLAAAAGDFATAEALTLEALGLRRRLHGEASQPVAESLTRLARVRAQAGRLASAESTFAEALALARHLGDTATLAAVLQRFGALQARLGRADQAEAMVREALGHLVSLHGELHPEVALAINDLALLLHERDPATALDLLRRAEAAQLRLFHEPHPDLATTRHNLGLVASELSRYDEAEAGYRDSLGLARAVYGEAHPRIARTLTLLARLHFERGDLAGAIALDRQALAMAEQLLDPRHLDLAEIRGSLGRELAAKGDLDAAQALFASALAAYRQQLGPTAAPVGGTLNSLADLAQSRGELAAAERLYGDALAVLRQSADTSFPQLAAVLHNLASLERARGNLEGAEAHLREAVALSLEHRGPQHPEVARMRVSLARLLLRRARPAEATSLARAALAVLAPMLPADDPWVSAARRTLAESGEKGGGSSPAENSPGRGGEGR